MIKMGYEIVCCQTPTERNNIDRDYRVVKCTFQNIGAPREYIQKKALELAISVNPSKANDANNVRGRNRLIQDALGGVLAEHGWLLFIKTIYGKGVADFTPFDSSIGQIDILLDNGKKIEVRSSFPRNGIKFAICNDRFNFKNICKYTNFYKPEEANKDFFASALFETQKNDLLNSEEIVFYLIGGSTRQMMNSSVCYVTDLVAEDDLVQEKTKYKVIKLKDALDINGFKKYMKTMGYKTV